VSVRHTRAVILVATFVAMLLTTVVTPAGASPGQGGGDGRCHAGAPGLGDDYPLYGNGGYVAHYLPEGVV
jgi:hypothetical protein